MSLQNLIIWYITFVLLIQKYCWDIDRRQFSNTDSSRGNITNDNILLTEILYGLIIALQILVLGGHF